MIVSECYDENDKLQCGKTLDQHGTIYKRCCCDQELCNDDRFQETCFPRSNPMNNTNAANPTRVSVTLCISVLLLVLALNF